MIVKESPIVVSLINYLLIIAVPVIIEVDEL